MPDEHTSPAEVKNIVHKELEPINKDFKSMRTWVISVLIAGLTGFFGYGVWVGGIQERVNGLESELTKFEQRIEVRLIRIEDKLDKIISN